MPGRLLRKNLALT